MACRAFPDLDPTSQGTPCAPPAGFEPAAFSLTASCTAVVLRRNVLSCTPSLTVPRLTRSRLAMTRCAPARSRTWYPRGKSPLLCLLSYGGSKSCLAGPCQTSPIRGQTRLAHPRVPSPGFEPGTHRLGRGGSVQLSYEGRENPCHARAYRAWARPDRTRRAGSHGRRDSNPQRLVLETSALPVELHPYAALLRGWRASPVRVPSGSGEGQRGPSRTACRTRTGGLLIEGQASCQLLQCGGRLPGAGQAGQ